MIIPAFNNRESIASAVASALAFDLVGEVVVVDDGSTDDTTEVIEALDDPRVRLIRQPNGGPAAARNAGARSASASHLVFLDADDTLLPDSLERFASQHRAGCRLVRTGALRIHPDRSEDELLAERADQPYPRGAPLAGSFSIERRLFKMIDGYDGALRYGENSELLLRAQSEIMRTGGLVGICGEPTVRVVLNASHDTAHYRSRRLRAIERMLHVHEEAFERDHETWRNHHAVASVLYRQEGDSGRARQHAWAALRLQPWSLRSWGRMMRAFVPVN